MKHLEMGTGLKVKGEGMVGFLDCGTLRGFYLVANMKRIPDRAPTNNC